MNRIFLFFTFWLFLSGCRQTSSVDQTFFKLEGGTMGTTYHLSYTDEQGRDLQAAVDSLLVALNLEVSTYIDSSTISQFNRSETGIPVGSPENRYFLENFETALRIAEVSGNAFDPTVMPLVNYWGFGYTPKRAVTQIDSLTVDSLMHFVGTGKVRLDSGFLWKALPGVQLDFSAIAKGYGVDEVSRFLLRQGIEDFMVEIGGELRTGGKNRKGEDWTVGINTPSATAVLTDFEVVIRLRDRALATSGNYRNYYEIDGRKYAHTIDPSTGYPEAGDLLSASVFAPDCATADAFATAFMVMGLDQAWALADSLPEIDAYFIFGNVDGSFQSKYTAGVEEMIIGLNQQ